MQESLASHKGKQVAVFHNGKVIVISPTDIEDLVVPFHCPVCEYPMKRADDARSYREYRCCGLCELFWCRSGTVPDKTSERWKSYLERRHMAFLPQISLK